MILLIEIVTLLLNNNKPDRETEYGMWLFFPVARRELLTTYIVGSTGLHVVAHSM